MISAKMSVPAAIFEPTAAHITPAMMGRSQKLMLNLSILPSMRNEKRTTKIGSSACVAPRPARRQRAGLSLESARAPRRKPTFTMCVNETAPALIAMTVAMCPTEWSIEMTVIFL